MKNHTSQIHLPNPYIPVPGGDKPADRNKKCAPPGKSAKEIFPILVLPSIIQPGTENTPEKRRAASLRKRPFSIPKDYSETTLLE